MNDNFLREKAWNIRLIMTDVDGVLTDNGVYYTSEGEEMKRFSIRDGMGVERLRKTCNIETGIITGELSTSVLRRAEKLGIKELHMGIKNKAERMLEIIEKRNLDKSEVAYIGDDYNDLEAMGCAGISACPKDAMLQVIAKSDYVCHEKGGYGAFREFAELLIHYQQEKTKDNLELEHTKLTLNT